MSQPEKYPAFDGSAFFADRLKQAIGHHSPYKFSQLCGISQSNLSKYLKGKTLPGLETLVEISRVSEVNLTWLITGRGPMKGTYDKPQPPATLENKKRPFEDLPDNGIFCAEFGQRLKSIRESKKHSIFDARNAFFLPLDVDSYKAMEDGYLPSSKFLFEELTRYCECKPGDLIYGEFLNKAVPLWGSVANVRELPEKSEDGKIVEKIMSRLPSLAKPEDVQQYISFYTITDHSMTPTFEPGDILIINKTVVPKMHSCSGLFLLKNEYCEFVRRATCCSNEIHLTCDNDLYSGEVISLEEFEKILSGFVVSSLRHYPSGFAHAGK